MLFFGLNFFLCHLWLYNVCQWLQVFTWFMMPLKCNFMGFFVLDFVCNIVGLLMCGWSFIFCDFNNFWFFANCQKFVLWLTIQEGASDKNHCKCQKSSELKNFGELSGSWFHGQNCHETTGGVSDCMVMAKNMAMASIFRGDVYSKFFVFL